MQQDIATAEPGSPEVNSQEYRSKYTLKNYPDSTGPKSTGSTMRFFSAMSSPIRLFFGRLLEGGECVGGGGPRLAAEGQSARGHRGPHQARPAFQHPLVLLALERNGLNSEILQVMQSVKRTVSTVFKSRVSSIQTMPVHDSKNI
jgi:hypothetical protein